MRETNSTIRHLAGGTPARLALVASVVATLVLSACGGGAQPSPAAAPKTDAAPAAKAASGQTPAASPVASPAAAISGPFEGEAKSLTGAGATFPQPLYTRWFGDYERLTGVQVNYQGIGSGGGIRGITDRAVDFGTTDAPMTDEQLRAARGEVLHIPTALGAVVATYNIPNLSEPLKFTPEALAGIYLGDIAKWNDPKLVADNPALGQVNRDIIVVHRSDGSGTTFIWTDYLSAVNPTWQQRVGSGTSVNWPTGLGGRGNPGVAGEVEQNQYSIGYVELIYALQNNLGVGQVRNQAGQFVTPTLESVTAAAAGVADTIPPDLRASIVDAAGENAYPISGLTWVLAYQNQTERPKAIAMTRLFWWMTHDGRRLNSELGYAPIPQGIVRRAEEKIQAITVDGQRAFPGR